MTIRAALLAVALSLVLAAPAAADGPVRDHVEIHNPVRDAGEHCGFPVLWDIHISADRKRYYDDAGRLTKEVVQVSEENTVTNLATGKTLRDGPVRFTRIHHYEDGQRVRTVDSGVMLNVVDGAGERLRDVGRVEYRILPDGRWEIFEMDGVHPAYAALDGNTFGAVLSVFCGVLD